MGVFAAMEWNAAMKWEFLLLWNAITVAAQLLAKSTHWSRVVLQPCCYHFANCAAGIGIGSFGCFGMEFVWMHLECCYGIILLQPCCYHLLRKLSFGCFGMEFVWMHLECCYKIFECCYGIGVIAAKHGIGTVLVSCYAFAF
ncbi:hypothetical protein U1Q18_033820 [Sarracenia purpurea var. burkii]